MSGRRHGTARDARAPRAGPPDPQQGQAAGAELLEDGRALRVPGHERALGPCLFDFGHARHDDLHRRLRFRAECRARAD